MRRIFSLCSTLIVIGLAGFAFAGEVVGQASVIDGDTLEIHGQRIRLYGIDSPENSQLCLRNEKPWRCGQEAALALSDHIGRAPIACRQTDTDRYGRIVAVCTRGGEDLQRLDGGPGLGGGVSPVRTTRSWGFPSCSLDGFPRDLHSQRCPLKMEKRHACASFRPVSYWRH